MGATADAAASTTAMTSPCDTRAPRATFNSLITPAVVDGTSIVAFSVSSVISVPSTPMLSPAFTATSIWAAPPPTEQAGTTFLPRSKGVGFYGRTVGQMVEGGRSLLLGANADGVYIFSGSEPEAVLGECV